MFNELFWMAAADAAQGGGENSSMGFVIAVLITPLISLLVGLVIVKQPRKIKLDHLCGLPFPNLECKICCDKRSLIFEHGAIVVTLPMEQILDITISKKEHIETQVLPNVAGAIAGAMDLGSTGAYLFGSPKVEELKLHSYVLYITYRKGEKVDLIAFDAGSAPSRAKSFVNFCKKYYTPQKINYTLG